MLTKCLNFLQEKNYKVLLWDGDEITLYSEQSNIDYYMPSGIQEYRKGTETYDFLNSLYDYIFDHKKTEPFIIAIQGSDFSKIKDGGLDLLKEEK